VCDDGTVLMDSALIIDYAETLAGRSLMPADLASRTRALRVTGLAMAACEKLVQVIYEHHLRPAVHAPWLARVDGQMRAALAELDAEIARHPLAADEATLTQAGLSAAIVWRSVNLKLDKPLSDAEYPALAAHSARAEALPAFLATPTDERANVSTPGYRAG
jgi:glutathione S-transferase